MKFCQKCWSEKLVISPGLIICKGCGHSKKTLNIVVNNDVDTGLYGKRQISYITQKSSKNRMIENVNTQQNSHWKQHIQTYQKTLKQAMQVFLSHQKIGNQQSTIVLFNLQQIWLRYLKRWRELGIPIDSIFTNPNREQEESEGLDPIEETDLKQQEEERGSQEDFQDHYQEDKELNTESRRRKSTLMEQEMGIEGLIIKEQHIQEPPIPTSKHQMVKYIKSLTASMTMNKTRYFKKLLAIKNLPSDIVLSTVRNYVKRLYYLYAVRKQDVRDMLSFLKFKTMYPKRLWLEEMAGNRNEKRSEEMSYNNLGVYIFVYDLLQYKLGIKSSENNRHLKQLIQKYVKNGKLNNCLINTVLTKFKLRTEYENIYLPEQKEEQSGLPPYLNFSLIYSFIEVTLLKSKQVFFVPQILENTAINLEYWLGTNYLRVNSTPSIEQVKKSSIALIHTLGIQFKESNRGRWIDRISKEFQLDKYSNVLKIMIRTLVVNADWVVNQQTECLAIIVMFCKLMGNFDQQSNVSLIPLSRIIQKYNVAKNKTYEQIVKYHERISKQISQQLKQQLKFSIREIIANINNINHIAKKKKFQKLSDLNNITLKTFQQLKRQDELSYSEKSSYERYKQIFSKKQSYQTKHIQPIIIKVEITDAFKQVQFKSYLLNEVPNKDQNDHLQQEDIILPSNNYQTIMDYRSNYYPLQKYQYMELLGCISQNRCTIDALYEKVQELQKQIILFQTN